MADPLINFISSVCVQTAVYWGNPASDGYGKLTFDTPIEISCRWDHKTRVLVNTAGKEVVSRAEVLVTQELDEEGFLFLGSLDDLPQRHATSDPMKVSGAYEIKVFTKNPLFQSTREFVYMAYLGDLAR